MTTSRNLEPLLRRAVTLVMASSAVVSGCESDPGPGIELDPAFVSVSCADSPGDLLHGLTPEPPVDFSELRAVGGFGMNSSVGEACASAQDKPTCLSQVMAASVSPGFMLGFCSQACERAYLVTTQGDAVSLLGSREQVTPFLGTIDTPQEAMLLVQLKGFATPCGDGGAKPHGEGFTVQAFSYEGCDGKTRHLFGVSSAGIVVEQESVVLKEPNPNCVVGRRPAGLSTARGRCGSLPVARYLADAARLEAASVHAFRQLKSELHSHGAPRRLISAARRAAADEVRHARMTATLARRFGAQRMERPRIEPSEPRDLEAMLLDNAVEGCVRETFGAAVGLWQAKHAADREVAKAMHRIASDELRHAALAWEIAGWAERNSSPSASSRIREARRSAIAELRAELAQPLHASIVVALGVPSVANALSLHRTLEASVWS